MATRVELTTRETRSEILNEIKSPRVHIGPLSDASNKSSDTSISSVMLIEDSPKIPSKPVSMFNPAVRPRLSPKPFFKLEEKPLDNRRSVGSISAFSPEARSRSDVPFQASSSISLSSTVKSDETERVGHRILTSYQPNSEEDQDNNFYTTGSKKLTNPSMASTNVSDTKSASQTDEKKVTSKPPLMARKTDVSHQEKILDIYSRGISTIPDEQRESFLTKNKNEFSKSEKIDSATVRAQLRPKRRPVSMFINDTANDSNVVEDQRTWNRRPLSSDLTSLFEGKGIGNKKDNPSEESKENRPLNKSLPSSSILEGTSDVRTKEVDLATSSKTITNDLRTGVIGVSSSRSRNPTYMEKERNTQIKPSRDQADVAEDEGVNISNQVSKTLLDCNDGQTSEQKNTIESSIAPGSIQKRISLFLASSSSVDYSDVPTNKEDRNSSNTERKTSSFVSDKEATSGRSQVMSHPISTDFTKKYSFSPSNGDLMSEKTSEENSVSQDYGSQKEKPYWRNSDSEKQLKPRRSIRKVDDCLQSENSVNVAQERKYSYFDNKYDTKTDVSDKEKDTDQVDKAMKTVTATMFEHNVERHNAAKVYKANDPVLNYIPKPDVSFERPGAQHESSSWSKWLSGESVQSVSQHQKVPEVSTERTFGKSLSFTEVGKVQEDILQNPQKVDGNRRVQPRYEIIQSVGEKVSSESVQMAPENKAVTLRSQRSFHKKEREPNKLELEETFRDRPGSNLQRSKSAYVRRSTQDGAKESSSRTFFPTDVDVPFDRRNVFRADKNEPDSSSTKGRTYLTSYDKSIEFLKNVDKSHKSHTESKRANALHRDALEDSSFGKTTEDKGTKKYFRDFSQQSYKSVNDSVESVAETTSKIVKDESTVPGKETKMSSPVQEKTLLYTRSRFSYDNEPRQLHKNVHKNESNDFINEMLNQDIEKIKKDLTLSKTTIEADSFSPIKALNKESEEELTWIKRKTSFPEKDMTSYGAAITSDFLKSEHDKGSRKIDMKWIRENKDQENTSTGKTSSPVETKATYFAVTGIDKKKEKNYNNLENLNSSSPNFTSEESSFQHDVKKSTTYPKTHSNYYTAEEKNTEDDLGTSGASKEFKTYRNQKALEHDLMGKLENTPKRQNVIDIDLLLQRNKQKPSQDKGSSYRDSLVKPQQKAYETEFEDIQEGSFKGSPAKVDGIYKSKIVDVDSLMADYNANHLKDKEKTTADDDQNVSKWERSRSLRGRTSNGSNKWKDPPKSYTTNERYEKDSVASWYTSQETTSSKVELKQGSPTISSVVGNKNPFAEASSDKNPDKGRESIQALPEKSQNITKLDSFLESSVRSSSNYKSRTAQALEMTADKSTALTPRKYSVDDQESIVVVKREHESSIKTDRKSISADERQNLFEGRRQGKTSDLINLMLENKEKREEQQRARQLRSVELSQKPRTPRSTEQQDWRQRESKEYTEKEELEITTDQFVTNRLIRHRVRTVRTEEDHVKQCFSRSSTSNKDTDSIVQEESDRQYGTWSQDKPPADDSFVCDSPSYDNFSRKQQSHSRLSSLSHTETEHHDSIIEAQDGSLDRSSMDLDSTEGTESTPSFTEAKATDFSFVDQTSVLDSTALKNRVQLSRKSQRRAPSQLQRKSRLLQSSSQLAVIEDNDNPWMFTDTTEEKPQKKEEIEEEEEKPQRSSAQSQRMPMFPGMDHSTLMAQLRKRQDAESSNEPSAQLSKSPKSPLPQGTLGVKLLPTSADLQDRGAGGSPQWLKELKSKKRQSQYENQS